MGKKYVSFFKAFKQALVLTQLPAQWVPGAISFGSRTGETLNYPHLVIMSRFLMRVIPAVLMQYVTIK